MEATPPTLDAFQTATAWVDDVYDSADEIYRPLKWFCIMSYMKAQDESNLKMLKALKENNAKQ